METECRFFQKDQVGSDFIEASITGQLASCLPFRRANLQLWTGLLQRESLCKPAGLPYPVMVETATWGCLIKKLFNLKKAMAGRELNFVEVENRLRPTLPRWLQRRRMRIGRTAPMELVNACVYATKSRGDSRECNTEVRIQFHTLLTGIVKRTK